MSKDKGKREYTLVDIEQDMETIGKALKVFAERLEALEDAAANNGGEGNGDSFGSEDKRKALSLLAKMVINPDDNMLPQMTETPDRLIVSIAVEHAKNEFIKIRMENPDSLVFFSDLLLKWYNIIMRSRNRALIGEALGFSQIEVDKAIEEAQQLESKGEFLGLR